MQFRRAHHQVEAVLFDGSERAARTIREMRGAGALHRRDGIEVMTSFGRETCRPGSWVARDVATGAVQVFEGSEFAARHEAAG